MAIIETLRLIALINLDDGTKVAVELPTMAPLPHLNTEAALRAMLASLGLPVSSPAEQLKKALGRFKDAGGVCQCDKCKGFREAAVAEMDAAEKECEPPWLKR